MSQNIRRSIEFYNSEVSRYLHSPRPPVDGFVRYQDHELGWSRDLKADLKRGRRAEFDLGKVRRSLYRPFTKSFLFFDRIMNEEVYRMPSVFPNQQTESENTLIWVKQGTEVPIFSLAAKCIPNLLPQGGSQCFPFYVYDEDGSNRRENITDWALHEFRTHYSDPNITKWDIFHYVYAVLHHPEYRERYAANLKRELPRIPFVGVSLLGSAALQRGVNAAPPLDCHHEGASAPEGSAFLRAATTEHTNSGPAPQGRKSLAEHAAEGGVLGNAQNELESRRDGRTPSTLPKASAQSAVADGAPKEIFHAFADAGKRLADLHVNYEQQPEYPLERVEKGQLNWRVEKMRLSKDKTTLVYNEFLTLKGIPPETYEYRLGNRSALEWVIDQYQVSTDKRSGIVNDPNRTDDPEYILRLVGQVITVSLETMKIVKALPVLEADSHSPDN